jgi:alkanesulfonate monooxygenase SsuD/methylene tetrahydromethanopterin reductase-like flavin-dependent oxidoreductase (luciferase family)
MAYDPSKIHKVDYHGKYLKFSGRGPTHPSPQRTPLIFQAGASKAGIDFGAKHAEAIFCAHSTIPECKKYVETVRAAAVAQGRDGSAIKFFLGAMVFVGKTEDEGKAKYAAARKLVSVEGGLARFSGLANIDMSVYPLDEPIKFSGDLRENAVHGLINSVPYFKNKESVTPRDLGEILAFGGLGPQPVGSAEQVADVLEKWIVECDIDGFNISRESC